MQPVDFLMAYSSEDGAAINCPNFQSWSAFRNMISPSQSPAMGATVSPTLRQNRLVRMVSLHRRFAAPRVSGEVR